MLPLRRQRQNPGMADTRIETPASRYDAIVIGSGAGGASLALRLAEAGRRVLVVERGDWFRPQPGVDENDYLYDVIAPSDDMSYVGGRTKFYGAALYRFRESDFRETQHESRRLPRLAHRLQRTRTLLCRSRGSSIVCMARPDGDPSEPQARRRPILYPPLPHDPGRGESNCSPRVERNFPAAPIPRGLDQGPGGAVHHVRSLRRPLLPPRREDGRRDGCSSSCSGDRSGRPDDAHRYANACLLTPDGQRAEGVLLNARWQAASRP